MAPDTITLTFCIRRDKCNQDGKIKLVCNFFIIDKNYANEDIIVTRDTYQNFDTFLEVAFDPLLEDAGELLEKDFGITDIAGIIVQFVNI